MRFLIAVLLTTIAATSAGAQSPKQDELIKRLVNLPAPVSRQTIADPEKEAKKRDDEFYRWVNIPPDDAPIEDLLEYWRGQRYEPATITFRKLASQKTAERLLEHLKETPNTILDYLGAMPTDEKTADRIRKIMSDAREGERETYALGQLQHWLNNNTRDGIDELTKQVRRIRDRDDYVANDSQTALKSLAQVDWDAARSHVERLEADATNPHSQVLAYWVKYVRAIREKDVSDADSYRRKLQDVVENKTARWSLRDLALDALVEGGDWNGRDEWYTGLFADETLLEIQDNGYTGLTTMMNAAPSYDDWIEKFLKLVRSDNKAIRSAAARNLVDIYSDQEEIIAALMPWVTDPNWAKESNSDEREKIVEALGEHDIPGAVPALITVLVNEDELRLKAAEALTEKKDQRAVPALRSVLSKSKGEVLDSVIEALIASGGLSADEQAASVEAYAEMTATTTGERSVEMASYDDGEEDEEDEDGEGEANKAKPAVPVEVMIGKHLADEDEPDDALIVRVMDREKALRTKQPDVADRLKAILGGWRGRAIYIDQLQSLRSNAVDLDGILNLLSERKNIREKLPNEVSNLRTANGVARAIGSCIAEAEDEFLSILGSNDAEAKAAMLGCTRLLKAQLPVNEVLPYLESKNETVKLAAERFLEAEDSQVSRRTILAKYPGSAKIMGAFNAFLPDPKVPVTSPELAKLFVSVGGNTGLGTQSTFIRRQEAKLQTEIQSDPKLVAIFANLPENDSGQQVIRVYKDRVTYTLYEDPARYRSRDLTEKEYKDFHAFLIANKIDEIPATVGMCHHGCASKEFLMLGRDGGRRTFVMGYTAEPSLGQLERRFEEFSNSELKLTYRLAEKIKGLEVLVADDKFPVYSVWKKDNDLRFLVSDADLATNIARELSEKAAAENEVAIEEEDEELARKLRSERFQAQQKRRLEAAGGDLSWRTLKDGKVGPTVFEPEGFGLLSALATTMQEYRVRQLDVMYSSSAGSTEFDGNRYGGGITQEDASGNEVTIKAGNYDEVVATADKRWVVATKFSGDDLRSLVRINVKTGQEFVITPPSTEPAQAIAYVPSHGRILIFRSPQKAAKEARPTDASESEDVVVYTDGVVPSLVRPKNVDYLLLDAATGHLRPVKGEFHPIEHSGSRRPQAASTPGMIWAAIYDEASNSTRIGLYSEKAFSFTTVTTLPDIALRTSETWVHEKENKVYFVYQGHLLAAPLREP